MLKKTPKFLKNQILVCHCAFLLYKIENIRI